MPEPEEGQFSLTRSTEPSDFTVVRRQDGGAGPVQRGAVMQLFGSIAEAFLGDQDVSTSAPSPAGSQRYHTTSLPEVRIGGMAAKVVFSGLAPGPNAVWQIDVLVPADVPAGKLPVNITYEREELKSVDVVVE